MTMTFFFVFAGMGSSHPGSGWLDHEGRPPALPILSICFLGEGLEGIDVPVLKVNRHYQDVATGDTVSITDPFVEALTHDSIVVQVNRLKGRRRTDLERLLALVEAERRMAGYLPGALEPKAPAIGG